MRIFLTGASGFIGFHLQIYLLSKGHELLVLTRTKKEQLENVSWLEGDLSDSERMREAIERFGPEAVFHLAWSGIPDFSEEKCRENAVMSINFLAMVGKVPSVRKIIAAGSCWEYGDRSGACTETDLTEPNNWFSWAKDNIQTYLKRMCEEQDIDWYWGRIFYVYGPMQRAQSLIPTVINSLKKGEVPDILTPMAKQDYIYVGDLVRGLACFLKTPVASGIYNLGSGTLTSVLEMAQILEELISDKSGFALQIDQDTLEASASRQGFYANVESVSAALGWEAVTSVREGLRKTLEHERK
jgi:nucleoside-diphosphate-sugar epimerase